MLYLILLLIELSSRLFFLKRVSDILSLNLESSDFLRFTFDFLQTLEIYAVYKYRYALD